MYPIRKGTAFYICLKWLNLTYCIQKEGESKWIFFVKFLLFRLLCSTLWFGVLFHMIMTIKDHGDVNLSEDLAIIMSMGGQLYSSIAFARMHKEWLQICEAVTDFSKFGKPSKFEEEQKLGNLYATLMIWYSSIGTAAYAITAFLDVGKCREYNERHNAHEICALGPIWLPVKTVSPAVLTLIDGIQIFSTLAIFWSSISAVFVIHNSAILTLTHFEKFGKMFHRAFEMKHENEIRAKLYHCIEYHNHILRLVWIIFQKC
nr:OR2 protein [Callosobruchus chinensis]